jgi:hypothetical protein
MIALIWSHAFFWQITALVGQAFEKGHFWRGGG